MQPGEPVWPLRRRRQLGDAKRRGVGEQNHLLPHDRLHGLKRLLLGFEVLNDRFDHQVAAFQIVDARGPGQLGQCAGACGDRQLAFLHSFCEKLLDPADALSQ